MAQKPLEWSNLLFEMYSEAEALQDYETCGHIWHVFEKIKQKYHITAEDVFEYHKKQAEKKNESK